MKHDVDLYEILQVHPKAEPEVIKAAFKRLSKKYHPDNAEYGAEEMMKQLNYAYSILGDAEQRKKYDAERRPAKGGPKDETEGKSERELSKARKVLAKYFSHLASGELEAAYRLISREDKRKMNREDFLEWQTVVGSISEIIDCELGKGQYLEGEPKPAGETIEFEVVMTEKERKSAKVSEVTFRRGMVLEKDQWRVFLGYSDIREITSRLRQSIPHANEEKEAEFDRQRLLGEISREIARFERYQRPFSLIILELIQAEGNGGSGDLFQEASRCIGEIMRKTDSYGRWNSSRIAIILPETRLFGAKQVVERIFDSVRSLDRLKDLNHPIGFCAGIVQNKETNVQELIDLTVANVLSARKKGEWSIVY
jgi:GGDEF domain-containing protein